MLESLEQEYRREEDWCGAHDKLGSTSDTDHVSPLISKHLEQKEAFLKVKHTPTHFTHVFTHVFTHMHIHKHTASVPTHLSLFG